MAGIDSDLGVDSDDEDYLVEMLMRNEGLLHSDDEVDKN